MVRVTAKATDVTTQAQRPVHLRNGTGHTDVVGFIFRLPHHARQAIDALKQQVTQKE